MDQQKIGLFLKELRKEKGLTQGQLAEMLNISNRSVSRWETGSTLPDISILMELAEFYDIDIKEILNGERKSGNMNEEEKELMDQVVNYTSMDKEEILAKTRKYSITAAICLFAGIMLEAFDYAHKYTMTTSFLFWFALMFMISVFTESSGKAAEMRTNKAKAKKYILLLGGLLVLTVALTVCLIMM